MDRESNAHPEVRALPIKMWRLAPFIAVLAGILFGSAGRLDLPWFWAYLACLAVVMTVTIQRADPGLIRERMRPAPGGEDRRLRAAVLPFFLAHVVVAGLDVGRYGWSGAMPAAVQAAGLLGFAGSLALSAWAVVVNPFFSPVVRIQSERGHRLITAGPYRFVRHPGYLAALCIMPCAAATLGSWWSILPLAGPFYLLLRRAALEDAFLHQHLEGYRDYAARVRWRLLPGVW